MGRVEGQVSFEFTKDKSTMNIMSHRFTTKLEEDDFGDLLLTIPYEICEELGWNTEEELDYDVQDNCFILKRNKAND